MISPRSPVENLDLPLKGYGEMRSKINRRRKKRDLAERLFGGRLTCRRAFSDGQVMGDC